MCSICTNLEFKNYEKVYDLLNEIIHKTVGDKDGSIINRIEKDLTRFTMRKWNALTTKGIADVVKFLGDSNKLFTKKDKDKVLSILTKAYKPLVKQTKQRTTREFERIYKTNKRQYKRRFVKADDDETSEIPFIGLPIALTIRDTTTIRQLVRLHNFAIGDHFPSNLKPLIAKLIDKGVIKKGLPKKQAGEFLRRELAKKLGGLDKVIPASIRNKGQRSQTAYFEGLSATNVTRARSFSQLIMMDDARIKSYVWDSIIDNRTSEICSLMNGRIFSVDLGIEQMNKILNVKNSDELKNNFSWRKDLSEFGLKRGQKLGSTEISQVLARAGVPIVPPAHFRCYSNDTEVYTEDGFVLFKDVKVGDKCLSLDPKTKNLEWVDVVATQKKHHKGKMVNITNNQNSLNMLVTPDHTMFYYKRVDHGSYRAIEQKFENMDLFFQAGLEAKLYLSSEWAGLDIDEVDVCGLKMRSKDFCRFMGFYLSDGNIKSTGSNNSSGYAIISQQDKIDEIYNECKGFGFKNVTKTDGKINIYDLRVGKYCAQFGLCFEKFIPDVIKKMESKNILEFLDAFNVCDGTKQKSNDFKDGDFSDFRKFFTTSKRMADDLGELLIKSGKSCSYHLSKDKGKEVEFSNGVYTLNHDLWVISEIKSKYRLPKVKTLVDYDDMVYDATLEKNHILLTRRDGRVVWGSNCRSEISPA